MELWRVVTGELQRGLTLLFVAHMPLFFRPYAMKTTTHKLNCLPSKFLSSSSSFALLFSKQPSYDELKVFDCQCFSCMRAYNKHKLNPRTLEGVFVSYSSNQRGYVCYHRVISKHVVFNEGCFPFSECASSHTSSQKILLELLQFSLIYLSLGLLRCLMTFMCLLNLFLIVCIACICF